MEKATKKKLAMILLLGLNTAIILTLILGVVEITGDVPTGKFIEISRWWDVLAVAVFVIVSLASFIFLFPVASQEFDQEVEFPDKVGMLGLAFGSILGPIVGLILGIKFGMTCGVIVVIGGIIGVSLFGYLVGLVVSALRFILCAIGIVFYFMFYLWLFKGLIMAYINCHKWAFGKEKEVEKKTKKK